jgi:hypothetical protein
MGELVPHRQEDKNYGALAPILRRKTPEELEKEQEHRIEEVRQTLADCVLS